LTLDVSLLDSTTAISCRNYSADATAFVVTYPIDSSPGNLAAALAWESAFIQLAKGPLSQMAAAANLSLAFQAERFVGWLDCHKNLNLSCQTLAPMFSSGLFLEHILLWGRLLCVAGVNHQQPGAGCCCLWQV
jgi:hypothetical protein